MKPAHSIVAFGLLAALAVFSLSAAAQKPQDARGWQHLAFSHASAEIDGNPEVGKRITQLGEQGWELVDVSTVVREGNTTKTNFYFKRPK